MRSRIAVGIAGIAGLLLALPHVVAAQDVCDRTPEVRDKLVASAGVLACEDVTDSHLSRVTSLDFENMGISSLQADDFSGLSNLETLDLSRNRLSSLPERVFEGLGSLQTLNLWSNDLTGLDEGIFEGLGNLEWLRLGGNDLSNLATELFDGLGNLRDLRLHYNDLAGLPEEIFDGLGSLERLELDNNELTSLPAGIFGGLRRLKRLYLEYNKLTELSERIFEDLDSLVYLSLSSNSFDNRNGTLALPEGVFDGLGSLTVLNLSSNALRQLPENFFADLGNLEYLNLQSTLLTSLPEGIFDGLGSLKFLTLRLNISLSNLPVNIFTGLDSLQYLNLSETSWPSSPAGIFDDVLDTLGGVFTVDGRSYRGGLIFSRNPGLKATLAFASSSQTAAEGQTVTIAATLSRKLPLSVRVPFTVSGTATAEAYTDLSPAPSSGLLFLAGETSKTITFTVKANTGNHGKTIVLTLVQLSEMGLRRSDGTGSDAPNLEAGILLERPDRSAAHTVSVGMATAGICNRTPVVRDILMEVTGTLTCGEVTAEQLSRVGVLDFGRYGIGTLQAHDFRGLDNLIKLELRNSSLAGLPEGIFQGLGKLKSLGLSQNQLTGLPAGVFSGLGNLIRLRLEQNRLASLPAGLFDGLVSLRFLNLSDNPLTTLPNGLFDDALGTLGEPFNLDAIPEQGALFVGSQLRAELAFSPTSQTAFQGDTVEATATLSRALPTAVRVPYAIGGTATPDDYTDLSPSPSDGLLFLAGETSKPITFTLTSRENAEIRGETIVLTLGELDEIRFRRSDGTGPDAPYLQGEILLRPYYLGQSHTVTLSTSAEDGVCNRTTQVRDALMAASGASLCEQVSAQDLSGVTELNVRDSGITELQAHDFSGLGNLQDLNLGSNQLTGLPPGLFDGLANLTVLSLTETTLTDLPRGIFNGLANLEELYLGHNALTALPAEIFGELGSLRVLSLEANSLTGLTRGAFDGLASLQSLHLGFNSVTSLGEEVFNGLSNLESLFLYRNSLTSLPERIFHGLQELEELGLENNKLSSLPEEIFSGLNHLRILGLSSNALTRLPPGIFKGLGSLEVLHLTQPSLVSLPAGIFDELHSLKYLSMVVAPEDLSRLPKGIFDAVLDTLGAPYFQGGINRPGYLLLIHDGQRPTLGFVSTGQTGAEGDTVKIAVTLSQALPLAVRVPFRLGGTATADAYTDLSPSPTEGLVFQAGETRREISLTLLKDAGSQGKTVTLSLGSPSELRLRRSDGSGSDAPHLGAEVLVHSYYRIFTHALTISGPGMGEPGKGLFVPVLLTSAGRNNSFFTSELALTNRGTEQAILHYTYTAHRGGGSGIGIDNLAPGQQRIRPDAIGYLAGLGIPIPASGNRIGTLKVEVSGSPEVSLTTRTATDVPEGRAGLAYPGIADEEGFQEAVYLCGLRQNAQDRSNVAIQNMGLEGEITLRTTVFSGAAGDTSSHLVGEVKLPPGGFHQYSGLLDRLGSPAQGYVKVEKVAGDGSFYAYGVINDNFNSDGSFVFPVTESSLVGTSGQTLPVIIETGSFQSELTVTNFSASDKQVDFSFVADAVDTGNDTAIFSLKLKAGEQRILPDLVNWMRQEEIAGIGPVGQAFVGALFAAPSAGDLSGIVIGARTGTPDRRGGQYSLFYNGVPYGSASVESAWIYGLQQNAENRSNLALVNTGEIDDSPITLEIIIYDGSGELEPSMKSVTLKPRRWTQENGILGTFSQGYVQVRKISGNNPFVVYGVINDGGRPGERTGDGAFVLSRE